MTEKINVKADWNDDNRRYFINAMVREIEQGTFVDTGFKKAAWKHIVDDLNAASGKEFNKQQCQSYYSVLKSQYVMYSTLLDNSGFGVDPITNGPTAADSVWDAFCKAHPKAIQFRDKPLKSYDELDIIFTGKSATGKYAQSSVPVTPRHAIELSEASEDDSGKSIPSLAGQKHSRGDITFCSPTDEGSKRQSRLADEDKPAPSTTAGIKPLPVLGRKLKEKPEESKNKFLEEIVANQRKLIDMHGKESDLSKAFHIFKNKYSANLNPSQKLKYQKYLKDNHEMFLSQEDDEIIENIKDCLDLTDFEL